jgi:hypothetical protein
MALTLLCGAAVGCSTASGDPDTEASPSLTGALQQYREDEVSRTLRVRLTNEGAGAVRVTTLRLIWPGLTGTEAAEVDYEIAPGATAALEVPYGDAACSPPARPAEPVLAEVVTAGAALTLPLDASDVLLHRLWDDDCARQRVLEAVDVAFGERWTTATSRDGIPVLRGTIELARHASTDEIRVLDLDGSVLLALGPTRPASDPLLTLDAAERAASLPVEVGSTRRCDGHSLGESKKTYVFTVGLDLGDGRVDLTLQPTEAVARQMFAVLTEACAGASASTS